MDREIKRILRLKRIPNFQLNKHDLQVLSDWESKQVEIPMPKKTKKIEVKEISTEEEIPVETKKTKSSQKKNKKTTTKKTTKKVKNIVVDEDKTIISEE